MTELVSLGHPDKVADFISDTVVDFYQNIDINARVACECLITGTDIILAGEVNINTENIEQLYKNINNNLSEIGYNCSWNIHNYMQVQSLELTEIVKEYKANDQSIVWGYANAKHNKLFLPEEYFIGLCILEDMKNQYNPDKKILVDKEHKTIKISVSHDADISLDELRNNVTETINDILLKKFYIDNWKIIVNPAGTFIKYGPAADTGVTGRKLAVDNYGQDIPIGGGAFSGKDQSKLDKSAAFYARHLAKNYLLSSAKMSEVYVKLSFMIGEEYGTAEYFNDHKKLIKTDKVSVEEIMKFNEKFRCKNTKYTFAPMSKIE